MQSLLHSKFLFLEGYLIASPGGFESYKKAINLAKVHDTKVAISLSDPFIVSSFKEQIKELINQK